jgi:hypothetical protein
LSDDAAKAKHQAHPQGITTKEHGLKAQPPAPALSGGVRETLAGARWQQEMAAVAALESEMLKVQRLEVANAAKAKHQAHHQAQQFPSTVRRR